MHRTDILELLTAVGERLAAAGLTGEMYVVGGAAIAIAIDERRSTHDIDAVFEPKRKIYAIAASIAEERGLDAGWLNDAVKGFLAGSDADARPALEVPGLRVATASPRILLAMKVLAHRPEDADDVRLLATELGLASAGEVLDLATAVYGNRLASAASFFVDEIFS